MHSITLSWKAFNICLTDVEAWLRANAGEHYVGNSADSKLTLWFGQDPGQTIRTACEQYWADLDEASAEATAYLPQSTINSAIETLRINLHTKTWDQMSTAERKLVLGQMPSTGELGL